MENGLYSDKINIKTYTYRVIDSTELKLNVYSPDNLDVDKPKAAIIFFFGGGWIKGTIDQFKPQSYYLASKGIIAITPDYRVKSRHGTTPFESLEDAKEAVYWVWEHAKELGINPDRIAVGGGSAGGHLAACTAIIKNPEYDSKGVYKIPKAMVLFNPVVDTTKSGYGYKMMQNRAMDVSPIHNVTKGLPPTILFHGKEDKIVSFSNAEAFLDDMKNCGNECILVSYEKVGHGFFNFKDGQNTYYSDTIKKVELFLREHGL